MHFSARTYDPNTGRFLQEDPLHFDAGDTNVFRFTWSNARNWRDPSGLSGIEYSGLSNASARATTAGGAPAGAATFATAGSTAAAVQAGNLATLSMIAGRVSCTMFTLAAAVDAIMDPSANTVTALGVEVLSCAVRPLSGRKPPPPPKQPPAKQPPPTTCPMPAKSFGGGTLVWLADEVARIKKTPIEQVQVGNTVLAWNPATNAAEPATVYARIAHDIYVVRC